MNASPSCDKAAIIGDGAGIACAVKHPDDDKLSRGRRVIGRVGPMEFYA